MKKKITEYALVLFFILNITVPAAAKLSGEDFAVAAGYAMDRELYMFVQLDDNYTGANLDTKVTIDGITIANGLSPKAIGESNATIKYLLVIDQSGSMNKYIDKVNAFVDSLADHEKANAVFTIAGFAEDFKIISEGITDKEAVKSTIAGLSYREPLTDPYNAIVKALNYVDTTSRIRGEVLNIIVVSDGQVDLGIGDKDEAGKAEKKMAAAAKKKIRESSEVLIHTFGVTEWGERCQDAYEAGRGDNAVIHDENDARAYGEKIAGYIDSLYFLHFSLKKDVGTERFAVEVQMTGTDSAGNPAIMNTSFEKVPNLTNYVIEESEEDIFKIIGSVEEDKEEDFGEPAVGPGNIDKGKEGEKDDEADTIQGTIDPNSDSSNAEVPQPFNIMPIIIVAVIAVCLLLAIVLLVYLTARKNALGAGKKYESGAGIQIWLDPVFGEIKRPEGKFSISDSLVIGSSTKADIVLKADGVCSAHARLFVSNGVVYIQDTSGSSGVFMCGMRLQAPNRLEDGDEITMGSARIVIRIQDDGKKWRTG